MKCVQKVNSNSSSSVSIRNRTSLFPQVMIASMCRVPTIKQANKMDCITNYLNVYNLSFQIKQLLLINCSFSYVIS
jgi:hypothetical protein